MFAIIIYIIAGLGAGIGTGLAGLSAAAVISPMLITFLEFPAYEAVGIALHITLSQEYIDFKKSLVNF